MIEKPLICNESDTVEGSELRCRGAFGLITAGNEIMYMPGGVQTITPAGGGIDQPIQVMADDAAAQALDAQRAAILASGREPFFDFNHDDGPASFWPDKFYWKESPAPGIYASGEWTESGRTAVRGKDYRRFSPVFHVDNKRAKPARIINAFARFPKVDPNMGGLVNNPSFPTILPLSAKNAAGATSANSQQKTKGKTHMTPEEIAALQAKNKELQTEIENLKKEQDAIKAKKESDALVASKITARENEMEANTAKLEVESLKAKNKEQADAITARAEQDADTVVAEMVKDGRIAAKDEDTKKTVRANLVKDAATFKPIYAKWQANPALAGGRVTPPGSTVVVTGTRPAENLRALGLIMAKQKTAQTLEQKSAIAKEGLAIYAKEIAGNKEALETPIMAADNTDANLGILSGTLVSMRTIEDYEQELIAPGLLTTDYSDAPGQFNQTTTTRIVVTPAVSSYNATLDGNGYPIGWQVTTPAQTIDAPVTLNRHKGVPIVFDSNTLGSTVRNLFGEQANLAGYALALDTNNALLALLTAGNYPGVAPGANTPGTQPQVVAQADFGRGTYATASAGFGPNGVPVPGRYCLMNSLYFGQLTQDPTLVSLAVFQKPEIITDAQLPKISKFQPLETPNLPTTGNLAAFFGHKSALVIQTRLPQDYTKILPGASFGNVSVITGKTGLSMLLVEYVNHDGGYSAWRIALMSGVAVGNAKGGKIITSA